MRRQIQQGIQETTQGAFSSDDRQQNMEVFQIKGRSNLSTRAYNSKPKTKYCISTEVVEKEMFPVIADENIDPIELNKKVTYGFTEWLSKMETTMVKEVQARQRQQEMKKRQLEYEAGVLRDLKLKEVKHKLGKHSYMEYRVKNCQSRQKRWNEVKDIINHKALEDEILKQIKQDEYLKSQKIFWMNKEGEEGAKIFELNRVGSNTLSNNKNKIIPSLSQNDQLNDCNDQKENKQIITQPIEQANRPSTAGSLSPLTTPAEVIHQLPSKTRTSGYFIKASSRVGKQRFGQQKSPIFQLSQHDSLIEYQPQYEQNPINKQQFKKYKTQLSESITNQFNIKENLTPKYQTQYTQEIELLPEQELTQTQFTAMNSNRQRVQTANSSVSHQKKMNAYFRSLSPFQLENQIKMEKWKLNYDKRRSKCINSVLKSKIDQMKQDEVITVENGKQRLQDLVKRKINSTKSGNFMLQANFSFNDSESNNHHHHHHHHNLNSTSKNFGAH